MPLFNLKILTAFIALVLFCAVSVSASSDPVTLVKLKDKELQTLLAKKTRDDQEQQTLKKLINSLFDFQLLGRKSLPVATWKSLNDTERQSFVKDFQRMVENSSVKKLEVYKSDSTRYEPVILKGDDAKVTAHVYHKGKSSTLVYRFEKVGAEWRAWDLIIDDLSTAKNYREQFTKILETKTFAELLEIIQKKAKEAE